MLRNIVPLFALAIALPLSAQERCRPTDTPRECFERWVAVSVKNPEAPAAEAVKTALASVNDGISDLNAPVQATLKDFLTTLSGSLDTAVVGDDATGVAFGYRPPIDVYGHLRLETKFTKPALSTQAGSSLSEADRKKLEGTLSALDDVKWALSYDWTTRLVGRDVARHRALLAALVPPPADAQSAFLQALAASGIAAADAGKSFQREESALAFENAVRGAGTPSPIETDFASVLNNQPQVYITGFYTARRDIVGPWELGGTATLELAGRNLNGFYRHEGRDCGTDCPRALSAYLARIRDPRKAPRIALTVGYKRVESTPNDIGSLTYGFTAGVPFASIFSGKEGRLEAGVTYDGTTSKRELFHIAAGTRPAFPATDIVSPPYERGDVASPTYERGRAAVTFTQSLSERVSVPVSFVYREVEYSVRFRQELFVVRDRESAVHVALRYRIVPPRPRRSCCC
ncbi:MAG TPA: hypothetical protein VF432_21975 [Thermoanaerobaculia bacterium]